MRRLPAPRGEEIKDFHRSTLKLVTWIAVMLGADQLTKALVRHYIEPFGSVDILPFLRLEYVRNRGIAFGMLEGHVATIIFTSSIVVILLVLATMVVRRDGRWSAPLALLVAGSFGNLIDRLTLGSVTDFLRVPHWPAFNLADVFIVVGVLLLVKALVLEVEDDEDGEEEEGGEPAPLSGSREQERAEEEHHHQHATRYAAPVP